VHRGAAPVSRYSLLLRDGRPASRRRDGAHHPQTVEGLRPFAIKHIITGHCTGWRALHALADAFGDAVSQSAVGTRYTFVAGHMPGEAT
jgi:hypothetical protein